MSKRKNTDLNSIGSIYGDMLSNVRTIEEKVNEIGEAPLKDGGPLERGGFTKKSVDRRTLSDKEKKDNLYNINKLSEEDEEGEKEHCKHAEKGCDCDECAECKANQKKNLGESRKIVKRSLNNFMSKKSVFEKLYENVMGNNFSPTGAGAGAPGDEVDYDESDDLAALGVDGTDDEVEDQVTFTLDRETAQKLIDVMQAALGDVESDMEDDGMEDDGMEDDGMGGEADMHEEDEQTAVSPNSTTSHAKTMNTKYNNGKNNKVSNLKAPKEQVHSKYTDTVGHVGDYGHALVNAKYADGKVNKVQSDTKSEIGKNMFEL